MKVLIKKNYIILFILILLLSTEVFSKDNENYYKSGNISNYFLGVVSSSQDSNRDAFKYLKKVQSLKDIHSQYNLEFLRTLVLVDKFEKANSFAKDVWKEEELFFEADLLLGLNYFINKDYINAEKHFKRLNKLSRYNLIFDNFVGNILISWIRAEEGNKKDSFKIVEKIPKTYYHLKRTQSIFLECFFDSNETQKSLINLIEDKEYNFSRYNFFLINYLLSKNKIYEAEKIIQNSRKKYNSNILLKQTEFFLLNNNKKKIKNFFNCKNSNHSIAEFFYVLANLYSSEGNYEVSNFYLKISFILNNNFLSNKALLAENFYYQKKYEESKKIYFSLKKIGPIYSWHASKNIASILLDEKGKEDSINSLKKDFKLLRNPNFEHFYELANFYKDNQYHEESIKYYSLALKKIKKKHALVPKILERRGTSFERIGDWESAEKDLLESLKIIPDQAHVLNYVGYTWVDKGIRLEEGLDMIKKANQLKKNDGYIIDSLGWVYFAKKDYDKANLFLQKAVELKPSDPVINDHYGDVLWMLNKNIQARYIWGNILKLDNVEEDLKKKIEKKLIFGINKKL
jgi:tetratricopeptide (TPR) repeat protein